MTFGERVHSLLEMRGLSIIWLAQHTGLSRRHLHAIVSGERPTPLLETAVKIATALDVSLEWLAGLPPKSPAELLPEEEFELALLRALPPDARRMLIEVTKSQVKFTGGTVPSEPAQTK